MTLDLESVPGVAVGIVDGPLSLDDIKACAVRLWQTAHGPDLRIMWDLRHARFDLSAAEVHELAEFVRREAPKVGVRTAFVVSTQLQFGLVRMFEALREQDGARTSVFKRTDEALEWLNPIGTGKLA